MKLSSLVALTLLSATVFAQSEDLVPVKEPRITKSTPRGVSPAQPTAQLRLKISSCMERDLRVETLKTGDVVEVRVIDKHRFFDCRGSSVERVYQLQISSDATNEAYVLMNPIEPTLASGNR